MSPTDTQQFPVGLILGLTFLIGSMYFAFLSSRSERRTRSTLTMTVGFLLLAVIVNGVAMFSVLPWRVEVLVLMASDLVLVLLISFVCLAQAGRLGRRRRRMPLGLVAQRPRLLLTLAAAPWVLLGAWLITGAVLMIWPVAVLESFDPAPPHLFFALCISGLSEAFYCALAGWVFLRSGFDAPVKTLRFKNVFSSAGCFVWVLLVVNATTGAAVRVFAPDGLREDIVEVQQLIEQLLAPVGLLAFAAALALRYVPRLNRAIIEKLPGLLNRQDRLQTRRWHLVNAGRVQKLAYASHYASEAARVEGLSEEATEKCLDTIQLTAIVANRPEGPAHITPEMVRDLHELQHRVMSECKPVVSRVRWPKTWEKGPGETESLASAPLNEALEATLSLVGLPPTGTKTINAERFAGSAWYHLAAVAAADAGFVSPTLADHSPTDNLVRRRAIRAYEEAKHKAQFNLAEG